ncbi:MAG: hypothetical protein RLZZ453_1193 [Chlamydiota bacterium]|jgi:hypothetical protein
MTTNIPASQPQDTDSYGWNTAQDEYNAAIEAETEDGIFKAELLTEIEDRDGGKISTGEAYQMLIQLCNGMIGETGDKAGIQGATQNLGSVGTNVVNQITSALSALQGSNPPAGTATQFCDALTSLYNLANSSPPPAWMDSSTISGIQTALSAVEALIPGAMTTSTDTQSPTAVRTAIQNWVSGQGSPSQDAENLQQLSGQVSSIGAAFSSLTSLQGGLLQNTMSQVSQMLNMMRGTIQSIVSSGRQMIQNQTRGG